MVSDALKQTQSVLELSSAPSVMCPSTNRSRHVLALP